MAIAILKPDHLGDLVLSSAAIRAIARRHDQVTLFVAPGNIGLAGLLFPDLDIQSIQFAHLSKGGLGGNEIPDLRRYDWVAILRNDHVINERWASLRAHRFIVATPTNSVHQTVIDYSVASYLAGAYDIDALHFGDRRTAIERKATSAPSRVGLSIGSGFHANRWPTATWIDLAVLLAQHDLEVQVICGPKEIDRACFIARMAKLDEDRNVIVGGADFSAFLEEVDRLDHVVASDGGTAHLCSLRVPVLSIFGPSPFLRFAPFGLHNRLLTRNLTCSPCCQYTVHLINGCVSMECMVLIDANDAFVALTDPQLRPSRPQVDPVRRDVQIVYGASHMNRGALLEAVTL